MAGDTRPKVGVYLSPAFTEDLELEGVIAPKRKIFLSFFWLVNQHPPWIQGSLMWEKIEIIRERERKEVKCIFI